MEHSRAENEVRRRQWSDDVVGVHNCEKVAVNRAAAFT